MTRCIGALLVRNEAAPDRYLARALDNAAAFCDGIVVLDDASDDETAAFCRAHPAVLRVETRSTNGVGWWGATVQSDGESHARARLWAMAAEAAGADGWVYVLDADHELVGISPADFRTLLRATEVNAWACPLWDCWGGDDKMRVDGYWQAHRHPRPWLARALPRRAFVPSWGDGRAIHAGHLPPNYPLVTGLMPPGAAIRHLGYCDPQARLQKARRYVSLGRIADGGQLDDFAYAHAMTVADPTPPAVVEPTPPNKRFRVLIGSVIRKPRIVLEAWLKTLEWQRTRSPLDIGFHFIEDFAPTDTFKAEASSLLGGFAATRDVFIERHDGNPGGDYGDGPETRLWQASAWHRVGALKNRILQRALDGGWDAVWLVDADVLCDPTTLQSLWDCDEHITAAVYWTHWQKPNPASGTLIHAGPQVWLRHPYLLHGRGYTEAQFRAALMKRAKLRVWGLGACTLVRTHAIAKGVNFARAGDLPGGPMGDGEDRHFCARADRLHLPLFADAWPDIYHAYHPEEYGEIPAQIARLGGKPRLDRARLGDLVSVRLRNLEHPEVPPQWLRGRLGALGASPEIEEALAGMTVGSERLLRVHFPVQHALFPGKTRTLHLQLLDAKPFALPPTVDRECLLGTASGSTIDMTTLAETQLTEALGEAVLRE